MYAKVSARGDTSLGTGNEHCRTIRYPASFANHLDETRGQKLGNLFITEMDLILNVMMKYHSV